MQLCLTKLIVILEIDSYVNDITRFFSMKELSQRLQIFSGISAKNDALLKMKEIVRIYASSKCLDRNVRWVLSIQAEYIAEEKREKLRLSIFSFLTACLKCLLHRVYYTRDFFHDKGVMN